MEQFISIQEGADSEYLHWYCSDTGQITKFVENYVIVYYYRTFTRPGATIPLALACVKYRAANESYAKVSEGFTIIICAFIFRMLCYTNVDPTASRCRVSSFMIN